MVHDNLSPYLTISEVSNATGLSAHTLRYYERIGLMIPVERAESGHRRYSITAIEWLTLLRRLRATGMSIADMQEFATLLRSGEETVPSRLALLKRHRESIEQQIAGLQETLEVVDAKIAAYSSGHATAPSVPDKQMEPSSR